MNALPTGKFGANAAWWRLNVLAYNLLRLLKSEALPATMQTTRPKGLRLPAEVVDRVRHSRCEARDVKPAM